jgi:hypothetical protein
MAELRNQLAEIREGFKKVMLWLDSGKQSMVRLQKLLGESIRAENDLRRVLQAVWDSTNGGQESMPDDVRKRVEAALQPSVMNIGSDVAD